MKRILIYCLFSPFFLSQLGFAFGLGTVAVPAWAQKNRSGRPRRPYPISQRTAY